MHAYSFEWKYNGDRHGINENTLILPMGQWLFKLYHEVYLQNMRRDIFWCLGESFKVLSFHLTLSDLIVGFYTHISVIWIDFFFQIQIIHRCVYSVKNGRPYNFIFTMLILNGHVEWDDWEWFWGQWGICGRFSMKPGAGFHHATLDIVMCLMYFKLMTFAMQSCVARVVLWWRISATILTALAN